MLRNTKTVLGQASAWDRFWRDFLEVWAVPKQTSKKFASEAFRLEISTSRQLLRSLGPLPETSARTPRSSDKSLQELLQSGDFIEKLSSTRQRRDVSAGSAHCEARCRSCPKRFSLTSGCRCHCSVLLLGREIKICQREQGSRQCTP